MFPARLDGRTDRRVRRRQLRERRGRRPVRAPGSLCGYTGNYGGSRTGSRPAGAGTVTVRVPRSPAHNMANCSSRAQHGRPSPVSRVRSKPKSERPSTPPAPLKRGVAACAWTRSNQTAGSTCWRTRWSRWSVGRCGDAPQVRYGDGCGMAGRDTRRDRDGERSAEARWSLAAGVRLAEAETRLAIPCFEALPAEAGIAECGQVVEQGDGPVGFLGRAVVVLGVFDVDAVEQ